MTDVSQRYTSGNYLNQNPSWGMEDSSWKAALVQNILDSNNIHPERICEIGCGAGRVLEALATSLPRAIFSGYDIAPDVERFWGGVSSERVSLKVGDFLALDHEYYDVILLLDMLEHLADPHAFLGRLRGRSDYLVVHFPLDLSALSVFREKPLVHVRRKVGHMHYFTKGLALELMDECGFNVIDHSFSGAAFSAPSISLRTRIAQVPRFLLGLVSRELSARILGGETLMVLATAR